MHGHFARRDFLHTGAVALGAAVLPLPRALAAENYIPAYIVPNLSAPLPDPLHKAYRLYDPAPLDYVVEERLMSGTAPIYKFISAVDFNFNAAKPNGEPIADPIGAIWNTSAKPPDPDPYDFSRRPILSTGPYTTRLVIYRPRDMRRFSGNLIIETIHLAAGMSIFTMNNRFFASRGDVYVGIDHPITLPFIKYHYPDRYSAVFTKDDTQLWGMLSDTARLLRAGGTASPIAVRPRHVYLTGYSFTAHIVCTFAKYHHEVNRLPGGKPLFDGYVGGTGNEPMPPLDVPIMLADNQWASYPPEEIAMRRSFDADGPMSRRRRYEIAGYQHAPKPVWEPGAATPEPSASETERVCAYQYPPDGMPNPNTLGRPVMEGIFRNMSDWVERGIAPPRAAIFETENGKVKLDQYGNALGGVRLPEITVPLATYSIGTGNCFSTGWMVPFLQDQLRKMYGTRQEYLKRYNEATDAMVALRFFLADTGQRLKADMAVRAPAF